MSNELKQARSSLVSLVKGSRVTRHLYYYAKNASIIYSNRRELEYGLRSPEIILVYQIGKVGSTSVVNSIKASVTKPPVYHIHMLDCKIIKEQWQSIKLHKELIYRELVFSKYLSREIDKILSKKKLKVITIVRDPLARKVSAFFQNIERKFPNFPERFKEGELKMEEIIQYFWKHNGSAFDGQFDWFDRELKAVLGIDVFSIKFPKDEGYKIIENSEKKIDLLLVKLESFNHCLEKALNEFLTLDKITIKEENISTQKVYRDAYKQFKCDIKFSKEFLEEIYGQRFVRHFYTDDEINEFKMKWSS